MSTLKALKEIDALCDQTISEADNGFSTEVSRAEVIKELTTQMRSDAIDRAGELATLIAQRDEAMKALKAARDTIKFCKNGDDAASALAEIAIIADTALDRIAAKMGRGRPMQAEPMTQERLTQIRGVVRINPTCACERCVALREVLAERDRLAVLVSTYHAVLQCAW